MVLFSVNSSHTLFLATVISVLAPCRSACDIQRAVYLPGCSVLTFDTVGHSIIKPEAE